jgi:hypothetical protein
MTRFGLPGTAAAAAPSMFNDQIRVLRRLDDFLNAGVCKVRFARAIKAKGGKVCSLQTCRLY